MTREEAIAILKFEKDNIDIEGYCGTKENYARIEAYDMAIKALRRETPKNPVINLVSNADGSRRLVEGWTEDALLCPVCHTYYGEVYDEGYCRKCGQKLIQKRVRVIEK